MESRKEVLYALGKTGRTGLQIVKYFQELILGAQYPLYPLYIYIYIYVFILCIPLYLEKH